MSKLAKVGIYCFMLCVPAHNRAAATSQSSWPHCSFNASVLSLIILIAESEVADILINVFGILSSCQLWPDMWQQVLISGISPKDKLLSLRHADWMRTLQQPLAGGSDLATWVEVKATAATAAGVVVSSSSLENFSDTKKKKEAETHQLVTGCDSVPFR